METAQAPAPLSHHTGLVLVGGGARGAYQAGVLEGLAEILGKNYGNHPFFDIITGISAGAINSAFIGATADRMIEGILGLRALWHDIQVNQVMRTDARSLAAIGSRWLKDLSFGGLMATTKVRSNHMLDTAPLHELLRKNIKFNAIGEHVDGGRLHGFAVSATNYNTGTAVSFYDAHPSVAPWIRSSRMGRRSRIGPEHILASASIPILFKPVPVDGAHYGDGGIRMSSPLSPAIHLGADRVLAISVRHPRSDEHTVQLNTSVKPQNDVSIADIAGVMLNAAFLDGLDSDAERMVRINQTISLINEDRREAHPYKLRAIPLLVIRPSMDLGALASEQFKRFPSPLRYAMKGIGASEERGSDLVSYLAFDASYCRPLLEIGRLDALAHRDEIEDFFLS